MIASYTINFAAYKAAQALHRRHNARARLWFIVWLRVMPVVSTVTLVLFVRDVTVGHFHDPALLGGVLAGVSWIGFYALATQPWRLRRGYRAMWMGKRAEAQAVELELSGTQLISRIPGRSEGRFERTVIENFVEDDRIALIYVGKKHFVLVPKTAMGEEGWAELRRWIGERQGC